MLLPGVANAVQDGEFYRNANGTGFVIEGGRARRVPDIETFTYLNRNNAPVLPLPPGVPTGLNYPSLVFETPNNCGGVFSSKSCVARCIRGVQQPKTWCEGGFGLISKSC